MEGGTIATGPAWSTIKVPIALRVLEDAGGPDGLSAEQEDLIARALTASDNEAAAILFAELEERYGGTAGAAEAVTEVLREGGDGTTAVSTEGRDGFSPYGQTDWALADQARFVGELAAGCVAAAASTEYVLGLMAGVTSDTWGLGSAGVPAIWKGGWGPDPDGRYLLRQMGVLELESGDVPVAIAVRPDDGSFESGQVAASELARSVAKQAAHFAGETAAC